MQTPREHVLSLESRLKEGGVRIDAVLFKARVDRSTWTRWKQGKLTPKLTSWMRVNAAAEKLLRKAAA